MQLTGRDQPRQRHHQPGIFRYFHDPHPKRHHPNQPDRESHGVARGINRGLRHPFDFAVDPAQDHCENDQAQPDVVQHEKLLCGTMKYG